MISNFVVTDVSGHIMERARDICSMPGYAMRAIHDIIFSLKENLCSEASNLFGLD